MLNVKTTSIEPKAYANTQYHLLNLANTVSSIGDGAFEGSTLTSIYIPKTVKEMGIGVFKGCKSLTGSIIESACKVLPAYTFEDCTALIATMIPNGCESIGEKAYHNCSSLMTAKLPTTLKSIGAYAFAGCRALQSLYLPSDDVEISPTAFVGCERLTIVTPTKKYMAFVPVELKLDSLSGAEYKDRVDIVGVTLSDNVTEIPDGCFADCISLKTVHASDNLLKIGANAFSGCNALETVLNTHNVESVGDNAFSNCSNLTTLFLGESVEAMSSTALTGCNNLVLKTHIGSTPHSLATNSKPCLNIGVPFTGYKIEELLRFNTIKKLISRYGAADGAVFLREAIGPTGNGNPSTIIAKITLAKPLPSAFTIEDGILTSYNLFTESRVEVPEGVSYIKATAFYKHFEIKEIVLPVTLKGFDIDFLADDMSVDPDLTFDCIPNLERIEVTYGNNTYRSIDGILLYEDEEGDTIRVCPAKNSKSSSYNKAINTTELLNSNELCTALSAAGCADMETFIQECLGDTTIMSVIKAADLIYQVECKPLVDKFNAQYLAEKKSTPAPSKRKSAMKKLGL